MKPQTKSGQLSKKALMLVVLFLLLASNLSFAQSGWYPVLSDSNGGWQWNYFTNSNTGYTVGCNGVMPYGPYYPRVKKTTDSGNNWYEQLTPIRDSINLMFRCVYFINVNTGFLTVAHSSDVNIGKILKTTNGGNNWYSVPLPVSKHMTMIHFINSTTGYATGYATILKTTDAGVTWVAQNPVFTGYLFSIYFTSINTGYIVGNNGVILKTTNGGENWNFLTNTSSVHLWGIHFLDVNTGIAVGGVTTNTQNIILRTTNAGENWSQIPYTNSTALLWSVRFVSPSTGYITGFNSVVLKTTNSGVNWFDQILPIQQPTYFHCRSCFFTGGDTGYICGMCFPPGYCGYIFKTTNGGLSWIKSVGNDIPTSYSLEQNYPNPFNAVTSIKFQVASVGQSSQTVSLRVFDLLGKEVATLVNEKLQPGTYELTFDAGNLPSGVYFYKLSTNNFSETKKLVLQK